MKVLVLHSITDYKEIRPYIIEQINELENLGVSFIHFPFNKKGLIGYLQSFLKIRELINSEDFTLVHGHYGLIGTIACIQRKVPVVITFHGSDINLLRIRIISLIGMAFARKNTFVSDKLLIKFFVSRNIVIPCGIDLDKFYPIQKAIARKELGFGQNDKLVLFTSHFSNQVKNYTLAKKGIDLLKDVKLVELKDYSREQVNLLMNACDCLLLTSKHEGSPQVIKEAMACNCPIVSTKVGDVEWIISSAENCFLVDFDAIEISKAINYILVKRNRSNGRDFIQRFDNKLIAQSILNVYNHIKNEDLQINKIKIKLSI